MKKNIAKDEDLQDKKVVNEKDENDAKNDNEKPKIDEKNTQIEVNNTQNIEPKRIKIPLIWIILFLIIIISCIIIGAIYFLPLNK